MPRYHLNALLEICHETRTELETIRQRHAALLAAIQADQWPDDALGRIADLDAALVIQQRRADSLERLCDEVIGGLSESG